MSRTLSFRRLALALFLLTALAQPLVATEPLPQDQGIVVLYQLLARLRTTARLMHTTAHPDDEDGGMLTLESRGHGASVLLLTLNRGEGGQNKFGVESSDELGILRTLELLAADRYYGVEQRFTRVTDFGFSKNAAETFDKWHGHEIALADMVRTIRTFRPDVLAARFQGGPRDGHGNHEASGILTREAFHAAADPSRFPEQIREGLLPWQAKKLYMDNVRPNEDYTLRLDTGEYSPVLGMSYVQFALEGLAHQTSQGVGGARVPPGHRYTYYKLLESTLPNAASSEHESDFFDGIDTRLAGLAMRLGSEARKVPFLQPALESVERSVERAARALSPDDPSRAAPDLLAALAAINELIPKVENSSLSPARKIELLTQLRTKQMQASQAAGQAFGLALEATVDPRDDTLLTSRLQETIQVITPGQSFTATARLVNRGRQPVLVRAIGLDVPPSWAVKTLKQDFPAAGAALPPGEAASARFAITAPANAEYTRPYWRRSNSPTESIDQIDAPQFAGLPFPPYPLAARAEYAANSLTGDIAATVMAKEVDPLRGQIQHPVVVGPALSVDLEPHSQVINTRISTPRTVSVQVRSNVPGKLAASVRLDLPKGWQAGPAVQPANFTHDGEENTYVFKVLPAGLEERRYTVSAAATSGGKEYAEGYTTVSRPDLGSFNFYRPSSAEVSAVKVVTPQNLKVGYIVGAGDDIPGVLQQIGVDVELIAPADLAAGNLDRFSAIITGIRAYDVRTDIRTYNRRLLDFVAQGGTLIVQYNQNYQAFNAGNYTPYPATESPERVSVETAPVEVLAPSDGVLHFPNQITASDFDGWVQERGLYFMDEWDPHFLPLLASHDPGEPPLKGGLLKAAYGKGIYIYTGYAFSRQLPAGVPGAIRLFVNLISAGAEKQ